MLESGDEPQTLLALQLLKGGGVHTSHLTHVLALSRWNNLHWEDKTTIRMQAKLLFNKYAPQDMIAKQKQHKLLTQRELDKRINDVERGFMAYIEEYAQQTGVEASILAVMGLLTLKRGAMYLLHTQARPAGWVLRNMLKNDMQTNLVFRSFQLKQLPTEIGDFPQVRHLDFMGNPLEDVPNSLQNLTQVNSLAFDYDKISPLVLEKLMRFFPVVMSNIFFSHGTTAKRKAGASIYPKPNPHPAYLEAIPHFEKGVVCRPNYAELWHNIGACWVFYGEPAKALPALHNARDLYAQRLRDKHTNTGHNIFWLSCVHALLGEKEQGLAYLTELAKTKEWYYLSLALKEEDWAMYHKDQDFLAICNSL